MDIITITAPEIAQTRKKKRNHNNTNSNNKKNNNKLLYIPSKKERSYIYHQSALAIAKKESLALPSHGGRPWKCIVTIYDHQDGLGIASSLRGEIMDSNNKFHCSKDKPLQEKMKGYTQRHKKKYLPLFRWFRGSLELACLPHFLDEIDVLDVNHGMLKSVKDYYDDEAVDDDEKFTDLTSRQITIASTVAWESDDYALPFIDRKWVSPNHEIMKSRKKVLEHCQLLNHRDRIIDKVLHGIGYRGGTMKPLKPTKKHALDAGYMRFLRDGLWVIGQEEEWIQYRIDDIYEEEKQEDENCTHNDNVHEDEAAHVTKLDQTPVFTPQDVLSNVDNNHDSCIVMIEDNIPPLASLPKQKSKLDSCVTMIEDDTSLNLAPPKDESGSSHETEKDNESKFTIVEDNGPPNLSPLLKQESNIRHDIEKGNDVCVTIIEDKTQPNPDISSNGGSTAKLCNGSLKKFQMTNQDVDSNEEEKKTEDYTTNCNKIVDTNETTCTLIAANDATNNNNNGKQKAEKDATSKLVCIRKKEYQFVPSQHWRLTSYQIDLCLNAIMDFYEKVTYTIKARALHAELADGFDVFRERGKGRFDMQIPAFDNEEFHFLTDLNKASWMPVVKKILGDDATIVHKGAFLSLPDSSTQIYHQDGPHLTTKYQRPCHAINVFIPLVDLMMKNGPTEFCVGTHILGFDYYSKEMLDTPLVTAGCPVIFDYRLGHRGLGNSSQHLRPILYLTYTSAAKEFRDSVNFSKKRYRKLGDLIEKPMSRQERALKRAREMV